MRKDVGARATYRELLESTPLERSDPFDSIVTSHLQSRGGSPLLIIIGVLLVGAVVVPPLLSLLSFF